MAQASNVVSIVSAQKRTAIISKYAALSSQMSALKKQLDAVKLEAIDLLGEGSHEAAGAKVTIQWVERSIFDQATAKSLLTPGQMAQCVRLNSFYDVRVKCEI